MIKNYYVFDDIISNEEQKLLNDYVKSSNIEWVSMENITGLYGGKKETHKFPAKVHPKPECKNEEINRIIDSIELIVAKKLNLEFIKNYRWKINWTTPIGEYNPMDLLHCDGLRDHIAMVYYINDSTGDFIRMNMRQMTDIPTKDNDNVYPREYLRGRVDFVADSSTRTGTTSRVRRNYESLANYGGTNSLLPAIADNAVREDSAALAGRRYEMEFSGNQLVYDNNNNVEVLIRPTSKFNAVCFFSKYFSSF